LLIAHLLVRPAMPATRWLLARWRIALEDPSIGRAVGPVRLLVALAVFRAGRAALWLPAAVLPLVTGIERFLLIIVLAWFALRLVELAGMAARRRLLSRHETATLPLVDVGLRALKIGLVVLATLMLLQALGVQVSALIAAVGVGGIGLALAAQRTVENLFGGLAVIGDQPVEVGDFCRFGDRQGTVERIGLWSTRVRTLERTVVSIPNAQFFTLQVENLARRDRILFNPTLRLRLETRPDQLRWVLVKIREMLYAHPRVDPVPARVRLIGFGQSAVDIEIFAYLLTTDFEEAMGAREDLCLRILDLIAAAGTALAVPSQVSYSGGADGLDKDRAATAVAEVEGWRRDGRLPLPEFSADRVKSLRATLDYPPAGSERRNAAESASSGERSP
jgi:MscS family membrane protein